MIYFLKDSQGKASQIMSILKWQEKTRPKREEQNHIVIGHQPGKQGLHIRAESKIWTKLRNLEAKYGQELVYKT